MSVDGRYCHCCKQVAAITCRLRASTTWRRVDQHTVFGDSAAKSMQCIYWQQRVQTLLRTRRMQSQIRPDMYMGESILVLRLRHTDLLHVRLSVYLDASRTHEQGRNECAWKLGVVL